jgi:hypothetical protein
MKPLKSFNNIRRKSYYKIIELLTYNELVWKILEKYKSARSIYLQELLKAVLLCGDIDNGHAVHKCVDCGAEKIVGFSCGKRFCNKCGYRRTENWVKKSKSKVLQVGHRHIIFTIASELWDIFAYQRDLLKLLSQTSKEVIRLWGLEKGIVNHGMICIIHTFGYDIKWNVHVHLIVTEGGLTSRGSWKCWPWNRKKYNQPYISFSFLQSKWRELFTKGLLKGLDDCWDDNEALRCYIFNTVKEQRKKQQVIENQKPKKERQRITLRHKPSRRDLKDLAEYVKRQEWYVNAESRLSDGEHTIEYVGRYSNRPAMAECRIIDFDGKEVTFWYDEKEKLNRYVNKRRKVMKLAVEEFIKRMLRHIPDKGFRMIEWFGLYASSVWNKVKPSLMRLGKYVVKVFQALSYRESIKNYFGYDPLICKNCGGEMLLYTINYLKDGEVRIKRYLGEKGYIAYMERRVYDYDLNRFYKVDFCGQMSFV